MEMPITQSGDKPAETKPDNGKLPVANYGRTGVTGEVLKLSSFRHMPGYNCQFSSLRKILAHYHWNYSEEMLVGLSSALGMIYWDMKMMPTPFIGGFQGSRKMITMGDDGIARLGGKIVLHQSASASKAHEDLRLLLRSGKPVLAFVDMAYLPYFFRDDANIPYEEAGHFGGHTVVVFGINEKDGTVDISDRFTHPVQMPISYFQMARASGYQPFPAKNKLVELKLPETAKPLKQVIPGAIKENARKMLNPPISNFGLKGFLKFKSMFPTWYKKYDADRFLFALTSTFIYMETGGTGGAWCRVLYSRFLKEAAEELRQPDLDEASSMFEDDVKAIRELETAMLPDELPNIAEIRKIFLQTNDTQEKMPENYRRRLRELDERLKAAIKNAKNDDYQRYPPQIQMVQDAIQKVYEVETKAWTHINNTSL